VLEFVSAHGGTVQIVDGEFPGAHFRISMPRQPVNIEPKAQAHAA
jgi:signal transduction histidine kinase